MQLFVVSQDGFDRVGAIVSFVASLTAAFAVPLTAALCAERIARLSLHSPSTVRAYRLTHLAFAAPPLFTALGVITGILGIGAFFATGITHGTVVSSSQWVVANSKIHKVVCVTDDSMSHLDPLYDRLDHNKFMQTLIMFLQESATTSRGVQGGS